MHAKQENFFTPHLPPPAPKSGCWERTTGNLFFQKPHVCVFKMISSDEGTILRYACWGTQDPPTAPPPPVSPPTPPPPPHRAQKV